ncbi:DNA primase [Sphingopyxis panaciterrae]|uniref:DNA primase n=1 Tax=Sphingopyxis panaciterrae TaxID=363841 RepID=UPI0014216B22|nr:DNA primase [Sphingopyxis panaciterrae]NIJ37902.1 DNA primase [Sphingopyxis panaciterrae]
MRFTPAWLDELRARVTLSTLIGADIKLDRAGREYKACCPFHGEKTPSFTVNDDKGFAHCFGCAWHGDAIRWMTDHRGLGFVEAVEALAAEAGMAVPAPSAEARRHAERIEGQRPTLEEAERIFRDLLRDDGPGRAWMVDRGIDLTTEVEFGLGFAPENGALRDRGFIRADLIAVGLVGASEGRDGGTFYYPRFRSRIMIPIHDARGRIVGFGGRTLPGAKEGAAKYINSPDSAIFDKGGLLFNLHRARPRLRSGQSGGGFSGARRLIIVEGYFDVVALHRLGAAAVAPMGTALTERQLERAWRVDHCPLLLFDGDAAGMKAAVRAAETALPMIGPGRSLTIGALPPGLDPDDLVRASIAAGEDPAQTLAAWLMFNRPMSAQECLLNHALEQVDSDSPEAWSAAWKRLQDWAATIVDDDTRALTVMHWRRRWEVAAELIADIPVTVRLSADPVDDDWACDECGLATDPQSGCLKAGYCPHRDGIDATIYGGMLADGDDARVQAMVMWLVGTYDDIADIQADQKFRLSMAKEMGFDPPMLRKMAKAVIQDRDKPDTRVLKEAREVAYRRAIGLKGPLNEEFLPPPFATGAAAVEGKRAPALPPPTRRIEAMMDMIEGRG